MSPTRQDLKRTVPGYRGRVGHFETLDVAPRQYLMVDGQGDPNTAPAYADALATLYPVAYRLKFASRAGGRDYVVPPLEALWWAEDLATFTTARDKDRWRWTAMLLVPDWLGADDVERALTEAAARRPLPRAGDLRLAGLSEGRCVQTLHLGSYDDEGPVLEVMHRDAIDGRGWRPTGRHHEIYLSDVRRTAPERLRTLLRQPVGPAE